MSNLLSNEFSVKRYIKSPINEAEDDRKAYNFNAISSFDNVEELEDWSRRSNITIITPQPTLEELEELWIKFNMQPRKLRREADWELLNTVGVMNQFYYEYLRNGFLEERSDNRIIATESANSEITYNQHDIREVTEWSKKTGIPVIVPTRTIDDLNEAYENWMSYSSSIREESDKTSKEILGISNESNYRYLKEKLSKGEVITESFSEDPINSHYRFATNREISGLDRARDLISLISRNNEAYEDAIISDIVDKSTTEYKASNQNLSYNPVPGEDLPFYTPEEIIDFGVNQPDPTDNFYGTEEIKNVFTENLKDWLDSYRRYCIGLDMEYKPVDWKNAVENLMLKKKYAPEEDQDKYNQAILSLGWPPEYEFSPENRVKATNRVKSKLADMNGTTEFIDLTGMDATDEDINESNTEPLKPVFIVLDVGTAWFSKVIQLKTQSKYTHAMISFDPTLHHMFSFGIDGSKRGVVGGFIEEDIRNKKSKEIGVFAIFLKNKDMEKLKKNIDFYMKNMMKTNYAYLNLFISSLFRIPMQSDSRMICSEFVDKMLKLVDIDLTHMQSSLVAPGDFDKMAQVNKKIYVMYKGAIDKFNPKRMKALAARLARKAEPIKESSMDSIHLAFALMNNIHNLNKLQEIASYISDPYKDLDKRTARVYAEMIEPCLYAKPYLEAKDLPVSFDKEGNLFIKNIKRRDYESEYAKCHKLLKKYEESGNIEGIKYELCKLWAMNTAIEETLYNSDKKDKVKEHKARSKILNDFNHYLKVVLNEEPDFNFEEYYNQSPFSDAMIKINKDTVIWSAKLLKSLMPTI